jgi:hypothetical protein
MSARTPKPASSPQRRSRAPKPAPVELDPFSDDVAPTALPARPASARNTGRLWLLEVPFDDRETAKWNGARWNPTIKRWTYRGTNLPDQLVPFAAKPYSWEAWCEHDANGGWQPAVRIPTVTLHPHQTTAVTAIRAARRGGHPGFLLADDVGLGKTYSTIAALDALGKNLKILVIAPLAVVPHWRRSINAAAAGQNRWCVINYDRVKNLLDEPAAAARAKKKATKNRRIAAQGRSKVAWDIIVCDESHLLRTPSAQRTAAVRQLIATSPTGKRRSPAFVLWLSATAGQNPLELSYLAPLLASVTGSHVDDLAEFENWCAAQGIGVKRGRFGAWDWVRNDADLTLMRELLFEQSPTVALRRRPADLAGWPEQQHIPFPVELDTAARRDYERAWEEFLAVRAADERARADALAKGVKYQVGPENPLTALLRFRQKASLLRVEATVELVREMLDNGRQVAVSVEFIASADEIIAGLAKHKVTAVRLSGAEKPDEREANRLAFQQGRSPVCVFTVKEGISLHASEQASNATSTERALIIHDPRWSAIATAQITGRAHRDGQNAVAYHCFAEGTVDEQVVAATLQRITDMRTMIGDDSSGLELLEALLAR